MFTHLSFPQPYYSTRLNAADIESRVKQLDQTSERENMDGADKKIKAGFWEEFDVSDVFKGYSPPSSSCIRITATFYMLFVGFIWKITILYMLFKQTYIEN